MLPCQLFRVPRWVTRSYRRYEGTASIRAVEGIDLTADGHPFANAVKVPGRSTLGTRHVEKVLRESVKPLFQLDKVTHAVCSVGTSFSSVTGNRCRVDRRPNLSIIKRVLPVCRQLGTILHTYSHQIQGLRVEYGHRASTLGILETVSGILWGATPWPESEPKRCRRPKSTKG